MSDHTDFLIAQLKIRISDPKRFVDMSFLGYGQHYSFAPVSPAELQDAQEKLGFQLPEFLRQLYAQVGNGGFGPGYGLLALNDKGAKNYHSNLVDWYLQSTTKAPPGYPPWPRFFVTICDWGDGITSLLNAADALGPIFRFRGDAYADGPWENVIKPEAPSMSVWLEEWLDNKPLFERGQHT